MSVKERIMHLTEGHARRKEEECCCCAKKEDAMSDNALHGARV